MALGSLETLLIIEKSQVPQPLESRAIDSLTPAEKDELLHLYREKAATAAVKTENRDTQTSVKAGIDAAVLARGMKRERVTDDEPFEVSAHPVKRRQDSSKVVVVLD